MKLLYDIKLIPRKLNIGGKAQSLRKLNRIGFLTPSTYVIPSKVQLLYISDPRRFRESLKNEIKKTLKSEISYAVRSSAEIEDHSGHSFAGQFTSILNVKGVDELVSSVEKVWESAIASLTSEYSKKFVINQVSAEMSVIIQNMVEPVWSGVAFSINPVTGLNEIIIEGIKGSGENLVQLGQTPGRWVFIKASWEKEPEDDSPGKEILNDLVHKVKELRKKFKADVDVEWVWDGQNLYFLQCRPVTAQKFPNIYSNHISREVLPGMIKPLVWSVNIPLVNAAWIRLLSKLLGPLDIQPEMLSKSFYYRAYFNMGTLGTLFKMMGMPKDSLESLMGRKDPSGKSSFKPGLKTIKYLPRMIFFLISNLNLGKEFRKKFAEIRQNSDEIEKELEDFSIENFEYFFNKIKNKSSDAAYYNIIVPLYMQITNRLLEKKLEKRGASYASIDFSIDFPGLKEYDPKFLIKDLKSYWNQLTEKDRDSFIDSVDFKPEKSSPEFEQFQQGMNDFVEKFGHFSESGNDFSSTPWRDDRNFIIRLLSSEESKKESKKSDSQEKKNTSPEFKKSLSYRRAGKSRLYREMISSEYTRCYGLFRILFLKTGKFLVEKHCLSSEDDVFYLSLSELNQLMKKGELENNKNSIQKVNEVRKEMENQKDYSLPSIIYGDNPPPLQISSKKTFEGIPVSPGIYKGKIKVIRGYEDFTKLVEGCIIVIPFSDVGWTPILLRAGAIVSESGGMLSHASIVAREMSIPAISSADHACSLEDDLEATIDGYNGLLIIEE